jgi:hypothetical protein
LKVEHTSRLKKVVASIRCSFVTSTVVDAAA